MSQYQARQACTFCIQQFNELLSLPLMGHWETWLLMKALGNVAEESTAVMLSYKTRESQRERSRCLSACGVGCVELAMLVWN